MPVYECSGCGDHCIMAVMYPPDAPAPEGCRGFRSGEEGVTAAWRLFEAKKKTRRNRR